MKKGGRQEGNWDSWKGIFGREGKRTVCSSGQIFQSKIRIKMVGYWVKYDYTRIISTSSGACKLEIRDQRLEIGVTAELADN